MGKKSTNKKMSMQYSAHLSDIVNVNESFDKGLMRVAYHGNNRNGSRISKKSFENAIPTLFYIPVVANYKVKENVIGSHDSDYVEDKNGEYKEVFLTQPVGLVPEDAKWYWEEVTEKDGVIHEYLCCEILLWKRQAAYEHIKDLKITDQSMEITVADGDFDETDGYYDIKEFTFTALCLLETAEPCFESAALHTYSTNEFQTQYMEMYKEFKLLFSDQTPEIGVDDKTNKKEEHSLDKLQLIKEYSLEPDALDFDYESMEYEELKAKLETLKASESEPNVPEDNFALSSQFRETLYEAVSAEKIESEYGSYARYCVADYDVEASEVYVYDREDYKLYGFPYSISGDTVSVDFECKTRKKYAIVDFEEGEESELSLKEFATVIVESAIAKTASEFEAKLEEVKVNEAEFERLSNFEKDVKEAELHSQREKVLSANEYSVLAEEDEFKTLVADMDKYSVDELQTKADLLFAKHVKSTKSFSMDNEVEDKTKSNKVSFAVNIENEKKFSPYGSLFD